jgi:hypothetical protein
MPILLLSSQMEKSFDAGYDPTLSLANLRVDPKKANGTKTIIDDEFDPEEPWTQHLRREEQDTIDAIIQGTEPGHYFMLLGPKVCPSYSSRPQYSQPE